MNSAEQKLAEDKALRDTALSVFQADLRFIREDLSARSVAGRITDRLGDSALDMVDEAVDYAEHNKGRVAAAVAAAIVWIARTPILHGISHLFGLDDDTSELEDDSERSDDD
ncbi:hypothetical protein GRI89_04525 [Altererythrobacter salegens]|uniref:Uncharacterized protein n=1 Tax=Croceibacterium salegens TaxID=1737568 RepID=A0A6I4SSG5_9SPHN|nr:hypothetical protein [Croceibacterium salegens]MXO58805.1 hypothetical protein [Croceibacterium salegens]